MPQGSPQQVVIWFDAEHCIADEMLYDQFERALAGECVLSAFAASVAKAVYCVIGNGLLLRGAVFFQIKVDEEGRAAPSFNLPLPYLAQQAGVGARYEGSAIHVAARGRCPVPWHSVNLWDPDIDKAVAAVQRSIYRNHLKLKSLTDFDEADFFPPAAEPAPCFGDEILVDEADHERCQHGAAGRHAKAVAQRRGAKAAAAQQADAASAQQLVRNAEFSARLTDLFGAEGKLSLPELIRLHTEQLDELKAKFSSDLESQQSAHTDQLRSAREEIRALKVALRQEQSRSRRLQELLRA